MTEVQQAAIDHAKKRWCLDDETLVLEEIEHCGCTTVEEAIEVIDEMAEDYGLIDPRTW